MEFNSRFRSQFSQIDENDDRIETLINQLSTEHDYIEHPFGICSHLLVDDPKKIILSEKLPANLKYRRLLLGVERKKSGRYIQALRSKVITDKTDLQKSWSIQHRVLTFEPVLGQGIMVQGRGMIKRLNQGIYTKADELFEFFISKKGNIKNYARFSRASSLKTIDDGELDYMIREVIDPKAENIEKILADLANVGSLSLIKYGDGFIRLLDKGQVYKFDRNASSKHGQMETPQIYLGATSGVNICDLNLPSSINIERGIRRSDKLVALRSDNKRDDSPSYPEAMEKYNEYITNISRPYIYTPQLGGGRKGRR